MRDKTKHFAVSVWASVYAAYFVGRVRDAEDRGLGFIDLDTGGIAGDAATGAEEATRRALKETPDWSQE